MAGPPGQHEKRNVVLSLIAGGIIGYLLHTFQQTAGVTGNTVQFPSFSLDVTTPGPGGSNFYLLDLKGKLVNVTGTPEAWDVTLVTWYSDQFGAIGPQIGRVTQTFTVPGPLFTYFNIPQQPSNPIYFPAFSQGFQYVNDAGNGPVYYAVAAVFDLPGVMSVQDLWYASGPKSIQGPYFSG